ncbi:MULTISPECIES: helix-turn-helix transcriptional regulator [Streptomyces]|uniref:Transcriptional regulator NarL n=1 Tax=Streptomyces rubrolavendulae TaxID=285473 RepID=A0A1D8G246_9ACTN|nr:MULTISPECIES: LuxR family transcriptional regulator [Streptomyces]AOT59532.1 transcriptional regulator NarL [Streptomyces rubrolavendulae]UQS31974.1 helix-turn-helix domain-containing protein [Streptomyces fradiae]
MLETLGLDGTAESVYRLMLRCPGDDEERLGSRLGIRVESVRTAQERLARLGLVQDSYEHPGRLRAVSPDLGLESLLARQSAELAAHQHRIEMSRAAAAKLISEYAGQEADAANPGVEQLVGLDAVRERLASLQRDIRQEVLSFAPDGAQTEDALRSSRPLNEQLLRRGVRMRTVYLDSMRNSAATVAHADFLTELGAEVRTVAALPTRMLIADRELALLPVDSEDTSAGAVILTGRGTLTALCALFDSIWEMAAPLGTVRRRDVNGLSGQEATALRLLAEGHTDEAIAKRLGVSHRTARRIATQLMERLGARSRFEAGVRAVQNGWLPRDR